jgi:Uma2 family endonuclease
MAALPAARRATFADLQSVPDHLVAEILAGERMTSPRPAIPHANAASLLGIELGGPFRLGRGGPGGGILLDRPAVHLGDDALVPDLAGWRRARMPEVPATAAIDLAPDWVCEVLSPSTVRIDRVLKMPIYARAGVTHLWLLDPLAQTLEVFRLDGGRWVLLATYGGDARVRAEPFDALELDLAVLWSR